MSARTILFAGLVYLMPMLICAMLLSQFARQHGSLSFILGAILASQVAAYLHWRTSAIAPSTRSKLALSGVLALLPLTVAACARIGQRCLSCTPGPKIAVRCL